MIYFYFFFIIGNLSAKKWRNTFNYEKLVKLFAKDRTTSINAEIVKEKRKRWKSRIHNDYESIEGIDQILSQNEATLESFDRMDDYMDKMAPPTSTQVSNQSAKLKCKKRKASNV